MTTFIPGTPRLAVDVAGSGPLVVLMHGIGGNRSKMLTEAAQRLVALYTAWGKPDLAAKWTATVNSLQQSAPTTKPGP